MGKEFELKYAAGDLQLKELEARYPHLNPIAMETTYFDTPDGQMGRMHWTFRRRLENGKSVCTLKTPASEFGRNEWETECDDISEAAEKLCALGAPMQLLTLTARGVRARCGARFTRLCGIIEAYGAVLELALDRGVLIGGGRELPFAEVEVELKEGSEEAALRFGGELAAAFSLTIEPRSKIARAIALTETK